MPYVFRGIKKANFYLAKHEFPWLNTDELPADTLADFTTSDGSLSIFLLEETDQDIVSRVVAAMAATRNNVAHYEYILFDANVLENANVVVRDEHAKTPDDIVNIWHRDIAELSTHRLVNLVHAIWDEVKVNRLISGRVLQKDVRNLIIENISAKKFDRARVQIKEIQENDQLWQ